MLKKMLTESCVIGFFAFPCCLIAILRDEYLTSAVTTKTVEVKYKSYNAMCRRVFGRFSRQVNKYLFVFRFTDFLRSCRYFPRLSYRLIFIMLSVGMVDILEFWQTIVEFQGPKHVHFQLPGFSQSCVITFFRISTSLCLFLFKVKTTLLVLWIFTSNILPHFTEFAGMKWKIISARQILTALSLKFTKSGKIYCSWILQAFIYS